MALVQKAFSDIITFSRSSNATRVGPTGLVEYAPHNLMLYSQSLATASAWSTASGTYTNNAATAPDGTVTATRCVATDADPFIYQTQVLVAQQYTLSVWIKAEGTAIGKVFSCRALGVQQNFSLTENWTRRSFTFTATAGSQIVGFEAPESATIGETVYFWGAQLSVGPLPLDYTPTTTAAVYGPRFDFDPVTLAAKGLLIEEQRTNLLTYSEQFDNAAWAKTASSVSANQLSAPNGTTTADKLIESATSAVHYISFAVGSLSSAGTYTLSIYIKAGERSIAWLYIYDGSTSLSAYFNLSTGAIGTVQAGLTATITSSGNGWYRCTITRTITGSASANGGFGISNADGVNSYTGDGTSGAYIWGAQLEAGSFATSLIPTSGSTVTRSADVASVDTLSPWFNATEGTLFVEATMPLNNNARLAQIGVSGFSYLTQISFESRTVGGNDVRFTTYNDPAYISLYSPTLSIGQIFKGAGAYKNSDVAVSFNGNAAVTSSTANSVYSSMTILGIGQGDGGVYANAHIRRIAYYPRRLTNAELQALSA